MGGISESYFSAYAVFLKASSPQVGLLASLPPLLASFSQLAAVWFGQITGARKSVIVAGALLQALGLISIAVLPLYYSDLAFPILLACTIFYMVGPHLGSPLWGSMMGALVPEQLRGQYFARRTRLSSIASFGALISGGIILGFFDRWQFTYIGFLVIFLSGVLARLVSAWHLAQIYDPPHEHAIGGRHLPFGRSLFKGQALQLRFSLFFACMQFAVAISGPFVVVYLLRDLQFSYIELTINTAASVLVQFLVLNRWGRLADLFGNRIILRVTGFTIPFIPALWVLSTDYWYLLLVQAISGLVWSGYTLSSSNFVFDLTPADRRAALMAVHSVMSNVAVFGGATLGGYLSLSLPTQLDFHFFELHWTSVFYGVFLFSSIIRLLVAFLFLPRLEEVRSVRRMSYSGLIFRVTRFSPVSGLIFDIVGRRTGYNPNRQRRAEDKSGSSTEE